MRQGQYPAYGPGQGLLETVVAIGIITTGLLSVITLVVSNLTTQREAALRYQAMNLAREGIELARNVRDSNWLSGTEDVWAGLFQGEIIPRLNPDTGELNFETAAAVPSPIYRCEDGTYAQGTARCLTPTPFSRHLAVNVRNCGEETFACERLTEARRNRIAAEVQSVVTWTDQGHERRVELNQMLYDWR